MNVIPFKSGFAPVHDAVREINELAATQLLPARKYHAAIAATKRAIHVTPTSRELWTNLGSYYWNIQEYEEARAALQRALCIDPDYAPACCNLALVMASMQRHTDAERLFNRALEIDPDYLGCKWDRSLFRLARGDYEQGFAEYETRIPFRKQQGKRVYPEFEAPFWNGEDLTGKSIYVASEQGLGDTILFSRFLPWLAQQAAQVYVCLSQPMTSLLWEFRDLITLLPEGIPIPKTDYAMVMGSLPHRYGITLETIPDDPGLILKRVQGYHETSAIKLPAPEGPNPLRIGLCWTGNPEQDRNDERSIPFELMLGLVANPQVWGYSLQVGAGEADVYRAGAKQLINDLGPELRGRGLTAAGAVMLDLDLVITCCTSIAHLAGALGVPCWVVLCNDPYWLWLQGRSDSLWYPSLRLFQQPEPGDWRSVMAEVQSELNRLLEQRILRHG